MRNNKLLNIVLLLLTSFSLFSQNEMLLEGKVTNKLEVEGIHVINTTSRFNAITDQYGNFQIEVNVQDTLVFSAINFYPQKVMVSQENYDNQKISITLQYLTNELDEVVIGNQLSGDIAKDLRKIKTTKLLNFDDVGIPGFKGKPKEKIPSLIGQTITPMSVDVESLYKHLSGYYKNLRMMRKWQGQSSAVVQVLAFYPPSFLNEAYGIPENRAYDFVLMCLETSEMEQDVSIQNYNGVLTSFKNKAPVYLVNMKVE